jgi:hypothetical protein
MPDVSTPSLSATGRVFWRSFVAAWVWPLFFFFGAMFSGRLDHLGQYFWVVAAVLFFYSFGRPALLWVRRRVSYFSFVLWGMLAPFAVWGLTVFAYHLIRHLVGTGGEA